MKQFLLLLLCVLSPMLLQAQTLATEVPASPEFESWLPAVSVADTPIGSAELLHWEAAYLRGEIGALAVAGPLSPAQTDSGDLDYALFFQQWLNVNEAQRVLITYLEQDAVAAHTLLEQLRQNFHVLHFPVVQTEVDPQWPGRLYATHHQRMVVDSALARRYQGEVIEFRLLANDAGPPQRRPNREERRLAATEPEVFRKASLGDEFEASTIPEIIVPGGIAFGEEAVFEIKARQLVFTEDRLHILTTDGNRWVLPEEALPALKASFDFALRSAGIDSDAVVDIDERSRVRIAAAFRDTNAGMDLVVTDIQPFEYIRYLPADKSIVIDNAVRFYAAGDAQLAFSTDYEVRYLRADRRRIAQTRVALKYRYDESTGLAEYKDSWGNDAGSLRSTTDYAGLGESTATAARYAAWVALFRQVVAQSLDFSQGRYEFLKIDKKGSPTPSRY